MQRVSDAWERHETELRGFLRRRSTASRNACRARWPNCRRRTARRSPCATSRA